MQSSSSSFVYWEVAGSASLLLLYICAFHVPAVFGSKDAFIARPMVDYVASSSVKIGFRGRGDVKG